MKKIIVLMSTFNDGTELDHSISSILQQTYSNFDFVIVDDHSTNGTYEKLLSYSKKDRRIVLIRNDENIGFSKSLNKGILSSSSDFIARMDADDVSDPERLEREVSFLESHPQYSMCGSDYCCFDENGVWGLCRAKSNPTFRDVVLSCPFCHPSVMVRRTAILDSGLYTCWPKKTRMSEDYDLWCKMYQKGYKGANISIPLLFYREGEEAYKKRKFIFQLHLLGLKKKWRKAFSLPAFKDILFIKDLLVGILPRWLYSRLHRKNLRKELIRAKKKGEVDVSRINVFLQ